MYHKQSIDTLLTVYNSPVARSTLWTNVIGILSKLTYNYQPVCHDTITSA